MDRSVEIEAARLKELRSELGWSAQDTADQAVRMAGIKGEQLTLTQQAISHFETGKAKSIPRWLRFVDDAAEVARTGGADVTGPAEPLRARRETAEGLDLVAIAEIDQDYGMGGSFIADQVDEQVHLFPRVWIESITSAPPTLLTIARGRGDSMDPTIRDRDIVIIDRSRRHLDEQDAIWALAVGEIGMIKRLRRRGETLIIQSDNDRVADEIVTLDEATLVGRVVFVGRRM